MTFRAFAPFAIAAIAALSLAGAASSASAGGWGKHGSLPRLLHFRRAYRGALVVTLHDVFDRHGLRQRYLQADAWSLRQLGRTADLLRPLADDRSELEAEVAWAVERELALSLDDVLSRRMRAMLRSKRSCNASCAADMRYLPPLPIQRCSQSWNCPYQ